MQSTARLLVIAVAAATLFAAPGHAAARKVSEGTPGNDVISGNARSNHVMALGGRDQVRGLGGDDIIYGGGSDDRLLGGEGSDTIEGGPGNDWIDGGPRDDGALRGGPGDDVLVDGDGNDWLIEGGAGDDLVFLGRGADKVFTEQGNDTIYVLPDHSVDKIRCDDGDQKNGARDRVIFVGWRDPLDVVDPYGTCEIVKTVSYQPPGWPYGSTPTGTPTTTPPNGTVTPTSASTPTATASPAPTTAALVPYSAGSYFKSLASGAPADQAKTDAFHAFMASNPAQARSAYPIITGVDGNQWGTPFAEGKASDPIWRVRTISGGTNTKNALLKTQGFHAPEWLSSVFTGTNDSPVAIMDTASGYTVFLTKATLAGDHLIDVLSAGITYHSSNGLDYRNPRSDDARNFTSRGRISDAMVIRKDLLQNAIANGTGLGHVLHLFIVESSSSAGFTHPMVGAEGSKTGWGAEGERLAIRADIDLTTRGLSPAGLAIARTLQRHGMYVGDNAGGASTLKAEQDTAARPVWGDLLHANSLAGITWADFVVLDRV